MERRKEMRNRISKLNDMCNAATSQTQKTINKLTDQLEREDFYRARQDFVSTTLQEFDNLDPGSLDVIFEYKCDDLMI